MLFRGLFPVVLAMLLFSAAPAGAELSSADLPAGAAVAPNHGSISCESLANPDDPTFVPGQISPLEGILPPLRDEGSAIVPWDEYDWGMDFFVYGGDVGDSQDFDVDPATGYLYAAFDTYHSTGDSIRVFRSTDSGETWSSWGVCTNTDGALSNAKVRIVTTGGFTWVCALCLYIEPDGLNELYLRRWHVDGSAAAWDLVDDDVVFADMDGDIGSSGYLYVTYVPDGSENDVWAARNALTGSGWVNNVSLFADPETLPYPAISAGAGGDVAVTFIDTRLTTNDEVRIKRSEDSGASWLGSAQVSNNGSGFELTHCDIALSRGTSGWITVTYSNGNLGYYYSTNTGTTWTYGNVFAGAGDEFMSSLRASKGTGSVTAAYNTDPGDLVYFTWANSSTPSSFSTPVQINDQAATGYWGPTAGWLGTGSYSTVGYTRISGYALYFDYFGNTGIEDGPASGFSGLGIAPNPFMDLATISFTLDTSMPVHVDLFDMSGRLVHTLADGAAMASGSHQLTWDGRDASGTPVPGGVYICRMTAPGSSESLRMVLVR